MYIPWQRFREDLPTLGFLTVILVLASASFIVADWADGLHGLTTVALVSLLAGYLLARSAFSKLTALAVTGIYGAVGVGYHRGELEGTPILLSLMPGRACVACGRRGIRAGTRSGFGHRVDRR